MAFAEILQGALGLGNPSGSQSNVAPRAAMVFTSRFRTSAVEAVKNQRFRYFQTRDASWLRSSIVMAVNPNSVKFTQNKRVNKKDTREGSVYFHFTNSKGQNNDILTMAFAGSTGNIDLRGSLGGVDSQGQPTGIGGADTGALYKLQTWQNLYLMTREPMLLADNKENTFTVSYASALFPIPVDFSGFFSKVLEFEENAQKPNSRNYSFDFTVTSTNPPLDELLSYMTDALTTPPLTVSVPQFANPVDGNNFISMEKRRELQAIDASDAANAQHNPANSEQLLIPNFPVNAVNFPGR